MKRHLIVLYIVVVVLLMAGRFAWQNCVWEMLSSVSAAAVIASTLIIGWKVIRMKPDEGDESLCCAEMYWPPHVLQSSCFVSACCLPDSATSSENLYLVAADFSRLTPFVTAVTVVPRYFSLITLP